MADRYFKAFPSVIYNGANCINIMERVSLLDMVSSDPFIYYPFDIEGHERADQFANRYYEDSYKSWILYITNNIMDPLRQWYLTMDDVNQLVTEKYGSVQLAYQKTKFFRNNWENAESMSLSAYNSLPVILQQYWEPVTTGSAITSYQRIPIDWTINTNRIIEYKVENASFINDEVVTIFINKNQSGTGQVVFTDVNNSLVFLQHVQGSYLRETSFLQTENQASILTENADFINVEGDSYLYGTESQTNTLFSSTPSRVVCENLTTAEDVYWTPVSYYEWENEQNEFNKTIRVLDRRYAGTISQNLKELLS